MTEWACKMIAFWTLCAIAWPVSMATAAAADATRPPNVVFIMIDDLGWADLGCYGSKYYRTPNLDRLATQGMRFTHAYAACPVCSPTRAALMTGKYPARLRVTDWIPGLDVTPNRRLARPDFRQELPLEETTIAEVLRDGGYATAAIGKWHLGGDGFEPTRQGFTLAKGGDAAGGVQSHFAPYLRNNRKFPGLEDSPAGEYLADRLTAEAERFIDDNKDRPFFLYLSHYSVHTPLNGKSEIVERYRSAPAAGLQANPVYAAMIENMDDSVGRVMQKLDTLKLADNTLFIFTSDNGGLATTEGPKTPATNNGPLREGKGHLYEGGIRVPLIVRWPMKVKASSTCATPTSSYDLFATIAHACRRPAPPCDGVSIRALLAGASELPERDTLYWHYPHYSPQGGKPGGAIRQGDYKLIEFYENGRRELYNVVRDVSENTNLADVEPERVERMATLLAEWRARIDVQMPHANPEFVPDTQADDGTITLPARTADMHGVMVRYEPLPHKNTIGFWVRADDWISWDFRVATPGEFQIEILQGCGTRSGGSQVEFSVAGQTVTATVEETGGFQKFVPRTIGKIAIAKPGDYKLSVKPKTKPGAAVMDLRQVRILPINR